MDAIITAGGTSSSDDPLYMLTKVQKKALTPLMGKPMISWVTDAMFASGLVENIIVVGLTADEVEISGGTVYFVDDTGGLIDNTLAGFDKLMEINPTTKKFLLASSDIPLITPEIVRGFIEECGSQEADFFYSVVEEKTMEVRFPDSKRTFVPFKGGKYSGGDLFLLDVSVPSKLDMKLIRSLTGSRKNYWGMARLLGFSFIIRFLFNMMTVFDVADRVSRILNLNAQAIDTRFAELGMDVDKPHQYEMVKAEFAKRES